MNQRAIFQMDCDLPTARQMVGRAVQIFDDRGLERDPARIVDAYEKDGSVFIVASTGYAETEVPA